MFQSFCNGERGASDMQIFLRSVIGGALGGLFFVAVVGFISGRIHQRQ